MSNLHQLGLAIDQYRIEHGGTNPPSLQALTNVCQDPKLFICPSSTNTTGDLSQVDSWASYVYRPDSVPDGVTLYCLPKNHRNDGGNILHGDGSVEWCDKARFAEVLKTEDKEAPTTPPTIQ